MCDGYFTVPRWVWDKDHADDWIAWVWLFGHAAWRDRTVEVDGRDVALARGQVAASVRFLARAWGWPASRVFRFLKRNTDRNTLETATGTGVTIITIRNFDEFSAIPEGSETPVKRKRNAAETNKNPLEESLKERTRARPEKIDSGTVSGPVSDPDDGAGTGPAEAGNGILPGLEDDVPKLEVVRPKTAGKAKPETPYSVLCEAPPARRRQDVAPVSPRAREETHHARREKPPREAPHMARRRRSQARGDEPGDGA